ncbi:MAG: DUF3306 domain-containing protein [Sulfitobacter sp.]|nr:DUF3306 domain-containing protein [Sulfitobacter sp.]
MSRELDFWARRKAKVQAEEQAAVAALEEQTLAQQHAALEEKTDAEVLAELELPDPDTLKMGDDFSVFMAKAVPERIRRQALRTLWRSNPVLANLDTLVDYAEDYTDSAMVVENMQTSYQVGKGMLKHIEELARQAQERDNPPKVEEIVADDMDEAEEVQVASADEPNEDLAVSQHFEPQDDVYADSTPSPRRMKFRIEESAA